MNNFEILLLIVGIVAGIALASAFLLPLLKKRGVDTQEIADKVQAGLATANTIVDGVQAALPNVPGIALIDKAIELAQKGAAGAEQLTLSSQLPADQRKAQAIQFVKDCLTAANVEITPDVEKIIDGAVEAAVFALPKTHTGTDGKVTAPIESAAQVATQAQ